LFRGHLIDWSEDLGSEAKPILGVIFQHVVKERDARPGEEREERSKDNKEPTKVRQQSYPEYIEYYGDQIGISVEGSGEDEFNSKSVYRVAIPQPADPSEDEETRNKMNSNRPWRRPGSSAYTLRNSAPRSRCSRKFPARRAAGRPGRSLEPGEGRPRLTEI
jgi:hypothetical protein